jgi:hypothetical protein
MPNLIVHMRILNGRNNKYLYVVFFSTSRLNKEKIKVKHSLFTHLSQGKKCTE